MPAVTIVRTAKLEPPAGLGVGRIVDAIVNTAALETVSSASLGLKTVYGEPTLTSREFNYVFLGSTSRPGSLDNYLVIDSQFIGTTGAPVRSVGSHFCSLKVVGE